MNVGDVSSWAAVFLGAVGIFMTFSDRNLAKRARSDDRRRRDVQARVLKGLIRQEIETLGNNLWRVRAELYGNPPAEDLAAFAHALMTDDETSARFQLLAGYIDMPVVSEFFDHLADLDPGFLELVEKVFFAVMDLQHYLEYSVQPDDDVTRIDWLREKYVAANEAVLELRRVEKWW